MRTIRILLILAILCLVPVGSALARAQTDIYNVRIPIDEIMYNECTGEDVHLTGMVHNMNRIIDTSVGNHIWGFQFKYQGVKGIGLDSGMTYNAVGGEQGFGSLLDDPDRPYHYTAGYIITMKLVSHGKAPDMTIKARVHVVVTPNYQWTVYINKYEVICK
jgi:hypothetical protein